MFCKYDEPALMRDVFKAAESGDAVKMAFFLKDGADPDMRNPDTGLPLLHFAVCARDTAIAAQLLEAGANPTLRGGPSGYTALHFAAYRGDADLTRLVLRYAPEVDATAQGQQTPLHLAAHFGSLDVVKALVDAGADFNKQDSRGLTPRQISVARTDESFSFSHQPYLEVTRFLWQKETGLEADRNNENSAQALQETLISKKRPHLRLAPRKK